MTSFGKRCQHVAGRDTHYKKSIALYNSLDKKQQNALFAIKHQVIVDIISSLPAIIDSTSMLSVQGDVLELREKDGPILSGELQDIFLIQEENSPSRT